MIPATRENDLWFILITRNSLGNRSRVYAPGLFGIPLSTRATVNGEMPTRRASAALLSILPSRNFLTLFLLDIGKPSLFIMVGIYQTFLGISTKTTPLAPLAGSNGWRNQFNPGIAAWFSAIT